MRRTVPPSAEIEEQIDRLLAVGVGERERVRAAYWQALDDAINERDAMKGDLRS